ncbi:MAG: glycoside hydrolase TIM-barrel-like domain-containing protein [Candidatus Omnitrophota bacterium]|nr:glycoside hydrolase TIM-barrel-like domain-containing protein [Candidatus Omnitrophota bacterium]
MLIPECAAAKSKAEFQKGICYVTWAKSRYLSGASDESLKELAKTGAKWVALTVNWYQDRCDTTDIFSTEKTASDASLIHAIEVIHSLGMKVLLKPHLDLVDVTSGGWRGEIACVTEPDWEVWFNNYANFVLHYAEIAQKHKVEIFCIGTELTQAAAAKEKLWRTKVIAPVRKIYEGPITYAANWNEEYSQVGFWDALDYIGIDAYFPLSEADNPNLADLKRGWEVWVKDIEKLQAKVNKPVIFPEVGYCSAVGTASTPWTEITNTSVDLELQANCYKALFETFWEKEWFYGAYWWRWGTDVRFGGPSSKGYSFQNKPAQDVVTEWYKKNRQVKSKY